MRRTATLREELIEIALKHALSRSARCPTCAT